MKNHEIVIRVTIEPKKHLTDKGDLISSQVMPHLRLTDGVVGVSSLAGHINDYADWLLAKGNDSQYAKNVKSQCRKLCRECSWFNPEDIDDTAMMEWLRLSKEQDRRGAKTRNHYRDSINGLCEWMVRRDLLDKNPIKLVPVAKVTDAKQWSVPTTEQVSELIRVTKLSKRKKDRWLAYAIAASTGLRKSEIQGLKMGMFVDDDYPKFVLPATLTKSRKKQAVFIPNTLVGTIRDKVRGADPESRIIKAVLSCKGFEIDREVAGIPKVDKSGDTFVFHSLRHYYNMTLANGEVDSESRRKLLRHGSLQMTEGVYTRTMSESLTKKINEVSFFDVETDPDPPIQWEATTEADPMQMVASPHSGTQVQILSSRLGVEKIAETQEVARNAGRLSGDYSHGGELSETRTGFPDTTPNTISGAGGGEVSTKDSHGVTADGHPHQVSPTPNANRPASLPSSHGLPGSYSTGSRPAAAPLNTPTPLTYAMLAEAYLAGLRDGRGERNGETE